MAKIINTRRGDTVTLRDRATGQVHATMSVSRCGTGVLTLGVTAPTEVSIEHSRPRDPADVEAEPQ